MVTLSCVLQSTLLELNIGPNRHKITGLAVQLALDRHNPQREMTSRLISDMYGNYVSLDDMAKGFDDILQNLNDLTLDTPEAPTVSETVMHWTFPNKLPLQDVLQ